MVTLNTDISTNNYGVRVIDAKNPDVAVQQLSIQIVGAGKKFIYNSSKQNSNYGIKYKNSSKCYGFICDWS